MTTTTNMWLCPLCALKLIPSGTTCLEAHGLICENQDKIPEIIANMYLKHKRSDSPSIGIARISDE
jgi:hypothetical protein